MVKNQNGSSTGYWRLQFFAIWVGQAFSSAGSALVTFALIWWLTETSGSVTQSSQGLSSLGAPHPAQS